MTTPQIIAAATAIAGLSALLAFSSKLRIRPWIVLLAGLGGVALAALIHLLVSRITSFGELVSGVALVCCAGALIAVAFNLATGHKTGRETPGLAGGMRLPQARPVAASNGLSGALAAAQGRERSLLVSTPADAKPVDAELPPDNKTMPEQLQSITDSPSNMEQQAPPSDQQETQEQDSIGIEDLALAFAQEQDRLAHEAEERRLAQERIARETEERRLEQERIAREAEESRLEQERLAIEEEEKRKAAERKVIEDEVRLMEQQHTAKAEERRRREHERRAQREEERRLQQEVEREAEAGEAQRIRDRIKTEREKVAREEDMRKLEADTAAKANDVVMPPEDGAPNESAHWQEEQERLARELEERRLEQQKAAEEEKRWLEEQERLAREQEQRLLEQERLEREELEQRIIEAEGHIESGEKLLAAGLRMEALAWLERAMRLDVPAEIKLRAGIAITQTLAELGWKAEALKKLQAMRDLGTSPAMKKELESLALRLIGS